MPQPEHSCLQPQDLILFEEEIRSALSRFVSFKRGVVTLSSNGAQGSGSSGEATPRFDPGAKSLTVPLPFDDRILGFFTAEDIDLPRPQIITPLIEASAELILKNIALEKQRSRDELTGLLNKTAFRLVLAQEIEHALLSLHPGYAATAELSITTHRAGFGVILIGVDKLTWFNRSFGHLQGDELLKQAAARLKDLCPPEAVLGRLDGDVLCVLFPAATAAKCQTLSDTILAGLSACEHPLKATNAPLHVGYSLGWSTYPKDMVGEQLRATAAEQACHLLEKASMALDRSKVFGGRQAFSFADILSRGARILKLLDQDRLMIDIGTLNNACVNQRFAIIPEAVEAEADWPDSTGEPKATAEIRIIEAGVEHSLAEVIHPGPSHIPIQCGDRLTLISSGSPAQHHSWTFKGDGLEKEIYPHPEFLRLITSSSVPDNGFAVMLIQEGSSALSAPGRHDVLPRIAALFHSLFSASFPGEPLFGEFGPQALSLFLPRAETEEVKSTAHTLCQAWGEQTGSSLLVGIAVYPCLDYHQADVWPNTQKALNHARLLPKDTIAVFDTLTLTISADQAFSQGDLGRAIEEYKKALLLDESNALARNSLGICYARTGKLNQALHEFRQVIAGHPENRRALYNVGVVALKLGDLDLARDSFEHCLQLDPSQVFCHIRLGQVAEKTSNHEAARHCFQVACGLPAGKALGHRHLGELSLKQGHQEEAKTHFQRALVHNPRDAEALHRLAEIYLTHEEDLDMAENMARLSVNLRPGQWRSIRLLEETLLRLGKTDEAAALRAWNSGLGRDRPE